MKKYLLTLLGVFIINDLSAGDGGPRKVSIVRVSKPASKKIPSTDLRIIACLSNGDILEKITFSAIEIKERKSNEEFRLPNPLLPLQKE